MNRLGAYRLDDFDVALKELVGENASPALSPLVIDATKYPALGCSPSAPEYNLAITGCQGTITDQVPEYWGKGPGIQQQIGQRMSQDSPEINFRALLGDNFYRWGVNSPVDIKFKQGFSDIYSGDRKLTAAVLGNHCYNFQKSAMHLAGQMAGANGDGLDRAMHQVRHTYIRANDGWVMPYRYYAMELPFANIFYMDSNTLPFDSAQQAWLIERYTTLNADPSSNKFNIVMQHHPLISYGKRFPGSTHHDVEQYLLAGYDHKINRKTTMNDLVLTTYKDFNLVFDLFVVAHDHHLAQGRVVDIPGSPCQLVVGGGGGKLQDVIRPDLAYWSAKSHGYLKLKIAKNSLAWTFFNERGGKLAMSGLSRNARSAGSASSADSGIV